MTEDDIGSRHRTYSNIATDVALDGTEGSRLEVVKDDDQSLAGLNKLLGVDVGAVDGDVGEGSLVVGVLEEGGKRSHFWRWMGFGLLIGSVGCLQEKRRCKESGREQNRICILRETSGQSNLSVSSCAERVVEVVVTV